MKPRSLGMAARGTTLHLVRTGAVHATGCYCSIEGGGSTYGDSADFGQGKRYSFEGLVADTRDVPTARTLILETMKDPGLTSTDKKRLTSLLHDVADGGGVGYLDFDETPMAAAARRLGYDAVRVVENDDAPSCATSVFVLHTELLQPRPPAPAAAPLPAPRIAPKRHSRA